MYPTENFVLSPISLDCLKEEIREIVSSAMRSVQKEELKEKFISRKETCKLWQPAISLNTLDSWTQKGLLKDYRFDKLIFYKHGEVLEATRTLKRYSHLN